MVIVAANFMASNISCKFMDDRFCPMFVGVYGIDFEIQDCGSLVFDEVENFCAGGASVIHFISSPER